MEASHITDKFLNDHYGLQCRHKEITRRERVAASMEMSSEELNTIWIGECPNVRQDFFVDIEVGSVNRLVTKIPYITKKWKTWFYAYCEWFNLQPFDRLKCLLEIIRLLKCFCDVPAMGPGGNMFILSLYEITQTLFPQ